MAVLLEMKVNPQSGKQLFTRDKSGIIKCFLKSAPEGGKANSELIKLISKKLAIPQAKVAIILGATGRKKSIKIETALTVQAVLDKLGVETQMTL